MILLIALLSDNGVSDSLQNVFFGEDAFHILDKSISLVDLVVFKIIDNKVESSFWDDINKGRENLESVLTTSENDKVVAQ